MVEVGDTVVPDFIREIEDPERKREAAVEWFEHYHSSRRASKRLFALFMKEEGIPFRGEDIQRITKRPPVETQS